MKKYIYAAVMILGIACFSGCNQQQNDAQQNISDNNIDNNADNTETNDIDTTGKVLTSEVADEDVPDITASKMPENASFSSFRKFDFKNCENNTFYTFQKIYNADNINCEFENGEVGFVQYENNADYEVNLVISPFDAKDNGAVVKVPAHSTKNIKFYKDNDKYDCYFEVSLHCSEVNLDGKFSLGTIAK